MNDAIEKRWYNVSERLPKAGEIVWFLWKNDPKDVVVGYRTYEPDQEDPREGWFELENKARWTDWWHPCEMPVVTPYVIEWLKK